MPLQTVSSVVQLQWQLFRTNTGFGNTTEGLDNLTFDLGDLNTIFNQIYVAQFAVLSGTPVTIDLTSAIANLVNENLDFSAVVTLMVLPTGADITVAPGASNGLDIYGGTNSVTVPANGCNFHSFDPAGSGLVVSGTAKTLTFTCAAGTSTVTLAILGKSP